MHWCAPYPNVRCSPAPEQALVEALAALHTVDPEAVGPADCGRPTGFMQRQVGRWAGQWERSKTHDVA